MKTNNSLSDYIQDGKKGQYVYIEFIKECVIRLKKRSPDKSYDIYINKIFGDKLI